MSVQQNIQIERERELENINHKIGLMGNFVNLVSVLIGESLLNTARGEVKRLSAKIEECNESKKEPMFTVELGFDQNSNSIYF